MPNNLYRKERKALTTLRKRSDRVIKPAEKGSGTVIRDHSLYSFTAMIILHFDLHLYHIISLLTGEMNSIN